MTPARDRRPLAWALLALLLLGGAVVHVRSWAPDLTGRDIYYTYVEGQRLVRGENPYARVLEGGAPENRKYATYLPVFYELSALSQLLGLRDFARWVAFWRVVFLLCVLGTAALIFLRLARPGLLVLAVLGTALWLFNRWGLMVARFGNLDPAPIFLLVLALQLLPRRRLPALLLLGLSLGLKQIGVFLVPLVLVWIWREPAARPARRTAGAALAIAAIPLAAALPFLIWNARGFVRSLLFSVGRGPEAYLGALSASDLLGLTGVLAKPFLVGVLLLTYALAATGRIGRYAAALLVFVAFVDFNPVLFPQYLTWVAPFLPLAVGEWAAGPEPARAPG